MSCGVCCPVVMDVSCARANIATTIVEVCCTGAAGSGAIDSIGTPGVTFAFVGGFN